MEIDRIHYNEVVSLPPIEGYRSHWVEALTPEQAAQLHPAHLLPTEGEPLIVDSTEYLNNGNPDKIRIVCLKALPDNPVRYAAESFHPTTNVSFKTSPRPIR